MTQFIDQTMGNASINMVAEVTSRPNETLLLSAALTSSNRRHPYKNITYRLTTILFSICLICLSTGIFRPNALEAAITPEYLNCGNVFVNGCVGTDDCINCSVTRFSWDWGDGTVADSWFPATHRYGTNGSYTVTVTAFCSTGGTQSTSTSVSITTAEDPLCNYSLLVYPATLILRGGKISETLLIELRDPDGALVSLNNSSLSFSSSNPAIVQVDASGVVTGTGFGEAWIEVTVDGFPITAKVDVFAGEFRVEPAILLLATNGQPTGQLNLKVANAHGSPLNLTGRTVTFHGSNEVAQVNGSGLVTALRPPQYVYETPLISAEIDGIWTHNSADIRVTSDSLNLNMIALREPNIIFYIAEQIGSFNYQQIFQDFDVPRITDIAYQLEEEVCGLLPFQGDVQYLVNDPHHTQDPTSVCGVSGNPVRIGTDVDKAIHNSCLIVAYPPATPQWGVFFHEIAHNFTFASLSFGQFTSASDMENSNFTYSEGLATAVSMYVGQMLSERATQFQIPPSVLSTILSSVWHFGTTPDLDAYINNGAKYSTIDPSILDDMISVIADRYGYSIMPRFFSVFLPPDAPFDRFRLNNSDANQATFFVAAMSAAAGNDLREDFHDEWGFPIDAFSFDQLFPQLIRLIAQYEPVPSSRITVATAPLGRQFEVDSFPYAAQQTFTWSPGAAHAIGVTSPQSGVTGIQYVFSSWNDGGAQIHSIVTPVSDKMYTANFSTQYRMTTSSSPAGGGIISPHCSSGCWYNSGSLVQMLALPNSGYIFSSWGGACAGTNLTASTSMIEPKNCTATFTSCGSQPAKNSRTSTTYSSLQSAYNDTTNTLSGDTIMLLSTNVGGLVSLARNISVALRGGYNCAYTTHTSSSIIPGSLTIRQGKVTIDGVVIQ